MSTATRGSCLELLAHLKWKPKNDIHKVIDMCYNNEWEKVVKMGNRALEGLIALLKDDDVKFKENIIVTLGKIKSPKSVESLIEQLKNHRPSTLGRVIWALSEIGDPRAIEPLEQARDYDVFGEFDRSIDEAKRACRSNR